MMTTTMTTIMNSSEDLIQMNSVLALGDQHIDFIEEKTVVEEIPVMAYCSDFDPLTMLCNC